MIQSGEIEPVIFGKANVVVVNQLREEDVRLSRLQYSYTSLTPLETSADSGAIRPSCGAVTMGTVQLKVCDVKKLTRGKGD